MPFSAMGNITEKDWTEIYTELFKPAVEGARLRYYCTRSQIRNGAFTKDIVNNLFTAYVVLADITFFNPNVMWELGVRHALTKRTILVARKDVMRERIISDLKIYGVIPYDPTNLTQASDFKKEIKSALKKIDDEPERSDNPVFDFLKQEEITQTKFEHTRNIKKLTGLLSELLENYRIANGIVTGEMSVKEKLMTRNRYAVDAIQLLVSTNYVNVKDRILKKIIRIREHSMWANRDMDETAMLFAQGEDAPKGGLKSIKKYSGYIKDEIESVIKNMNIVLENLKQNKEDEVDPSLWCWEQENLKLLK